MQENQEELSLKQIFDINFLNYSLKKLYHSFFDLDNKKNYFVLSALEVSL